jgi:hypothetical protein
MRIFATYLLLLSIFTSCTINSAGQKTEIIYLDKKDTASNKYLIIYPAKLPWRGFMFLIPSFNETAQSVLEQTDIPKNAAAQGILTIIPTFKTGVQSFGIDEETQASFKDILMDVTSRHKLIDLPFFVGGFSIGGSCAVKFAELAIQEKYTYTPKAIFAIDPPLDFERFYNASKRSIRLAKTSSMNEESVYFSERIEKEMKGKPENSLINFYKHSPYSFSDSSQTAIKNLIKTPIRIYSEPDINWWLSQRGSDYSNMNIFDAAAMINELNRLGNTKATLIVTENKGFKKPDNTRHPHSWSIAEPNELINWLLEQR